MRGCRSFFGAFNLVVLCFVIALISGCASPAAKAVKRGDELLTAKNYYDASGEYLTALSLEPDNKDAKLKLCQTANQAYGQKLDVAAGFERASEYESALPHYKDLAGFIDKAKSYGCLNMATIDANQKIAEMKTSASEAYYKIAETSFNNADYGNAIVNYQEALKHNDPYKDCAMKLAESNYRAAQASVLKNNYREGADYFSKADGFVAGFKDSRKLSVKYKGIADERDAKTHYDSGIASVKAGNFRDASEQFETAASFIANYKDAQALAVKYKAIADEKDAQSHYENGMNAVSSGNYREAAESFEKSNSFVSNYKDAQSLSIKYKKMADENDARLHYERGQSYFAQNKYAEAEKEFLASDGFVKGYKDAGELARKSNVYDSITIVLDIDTPPHTVKDVATKMKQDNCAEFFQALVKQFAVENDYRVQNNILMALSSYSNQEWTRLLRNIIDRGRSRQYDVVWAGIISAYGYSCKANPSFGACGNVIPLMCRLYCYDPDKDTFQGVKRAAGDVLQNYSWRTDYLSECIKANRGCN